MLFLANRTALYKSRLAWLFLGLILLGAPFFGYRFVKNKAVPHIQKVEKKVVLSTPLPATTPQIVSSPTPIAMGSDPVLDKNQVPEISTMVNDQINALPTTGPTLNLNSVILTSLVAGLLGRYFVLKRKLRKEYQNISVSA